MWKEKVFLTRQHCPKSREVYTVPVLIECILTGLKVFDVNSEIRQTNKGGAENQLTGESCSTGEDSESEERQQMIQQESCNKKSEVGELTV